MATRIDVLAGAPMPPGRCRRRSMAILAMLGIVANVATA